MRRSMLATLRVLAILSLTIAAFGMPGHAQGSEEDDDEILGDEIYDDEVIEAAGGGDIAEFAAFVYEYDPATEEIGEEPLAQVGELELLSEYDDDPGEVADELWLALAGSLSEPPVLYGDIEGTDASVEDLLAEPLVLVVYAGEDILEPVIVAGAIDGDVDEYGGVLFELEEVDESGYEGLAYIGPVDEDEFELLDVDVAENHVIIGVWQTATFDLESTPES